MQTFLIATATVALAEVGDKTQLLSLILAARYRRPWPICIGILLATIVNHALAGAVGELLARWLTPRGPALDRGGLAAGHGGVDPDPRPHGGGRRRGAAAAHGVMVATIIAFFLAEMGDKTQIATVVLAAQYHPLWQVVAGTTVGMLLANVPVVWLGSRFADRLPLRATRIAAALLFAGLAVWTLVSGRPRTLDREAPAGAPEGAECLPQGAHLARSARDRPSAIATVQMCWPWRNRPVRRQEMQHQGEQHGGEQAGDHIVQHHADAALHARSSQRIGHGLSTSKKRNSTKPATTAHQGAASAGSSAIHWPIELVPDQRTVIGHAQAPPALAAGPQADGETDDQHQSPGRRADAAHDATTAGSPRPSRPCPAPRRQPRAETERQPAGRVRQERRALRRE